jgi:hypothetical protein
MNDTFERLRMDGVISNPRMTIGPNCFRTDAMLATGRSVPASDSSPRVELSISSRWANRTRLNARASKRAEEVDLKNQ